MENSSGNNTSIETSTFGQGCFWCSEAIFSNLKGVTSVTSGYSGGKTPNPTYEQVCSGDTGHAEAIQITFYPNLISYKQLLEAFWGSHDPTTLNRQGGDIGTQYRSVVFYHNENQKETAEKLKKELDASGAFNDPIVTEIAPFTNFYPAEGYHQEYYKFHGSAPYCQMVIKPKLEKFKKVFQESLK